MYIFKSFLATFALFIVSFQSNAQYPVQIGTPESGGVILPYNNQFDYNWCTTIYPQDKINAWGNIVEVTYNVGSIDGEMDLAKNQKIFMALSSDVQFTDAGYPDTLSMTKVFDGYIVFANGWQNNTTEITLTTPFYYNNSDNLIIHYENRDGEKATIFNEAKMNLSDNSSSYNICKYNSQDGSFPASNGTLSNKMPIVYLGFESGLDAGISEINNNEDFLLPGNHDLAIKFRNYSGDTITTADINWELNGIPQSTINWTGTLYTGHQSTDINLLSNYDFSPGTYTVKAWIDDPNAGVDLDKTNDTLSLNISLNYYIEVGDHFDNHISSVPYPSIYGYGWSSSIYKNDSIPSGEIYGISYKTLNTGLIQKQQKIFFTETNNTVFTSPDFPNEEAMSLVYEGTIDYSGTMGWKKILFDTSFIYNNASNFLIHYQNLLGQAKSPITKFASTYYSAQTSITKGDNSIFPTTAGSFLYQAPDIRLYYALPNDAGIIAINEPAISFNAGISNITIGQKNFGNEVLNSVDIKYQIDEGVIETYNWAGNLSAYESIDNVVIGTHDFSYGNHIMKIWTEKPNGFNDYNNDNDSLSVSVFAGTPLSGNYIIGSAPSDFTTLKEAIDSLNNQSGISGSVIFDIKPGIYNSQNILSNIKGSNELFNVTFRSQTNDSNDVIITSDSTDFTLSLNGANYTHFENLTFTTDTISSSILDISNHSNKISFESCVFSGNLNSGILLTSANNEYYCSNSLILTNNKFIKGHTGVFLNDRGVVISNNYFEDQFYYGINFEYQDSILISNNTFNSGQYAINGRGKNVTISGNLMMENVQLTFKLMGADYLVINNMAYVLGSPFLATCVSLSIDNSKIYNNTLQKKQGIQDFGIITIYGDNNDFKNNIFINQGSREIFNLEWGADGNTFDHNIYYTNGSVLGNKNGVAYPELSDWQSGTSQDLNSFFKAVNFSSETDLHTFSLIANGAGTPLTEVTTDFDNEIRNGVNPDIGADEFTSLCTSPLTGTYSLGATGTYKSFEEAMNALFFCGIEGDVIFEIEDGTYNDQLLFNNPIPGQGSYSLVFRSANADKSKVIIEHGSDSANNYVIKLDGADKIGFEDITIKSLDYNYGRVIELINQADNNYFSNTIIEGQETALDQKDLALIYINELETANENVVFNNNVLKYGAYGVYVESSKYGNLLTISNNTFIDQGAGAFYCYHAGVVNLNSNTSIHSIQSENYNAVYSDYSDSVSISNNIISIVSDNSSYGLMISGKQSVINNFISIESSGNKKNTGIFSSGNAWILNNSVSISGSGTYTRVIDLSQIEESEILNNIFSNSAGGTAIYMESWSNPWIMDYNCLYSRGEYLAYRGANYKTLAEWKAATSYDDHSVYINPLFVSESDLHTAAVLLNGKAIPSILVATDIDGEPRDAISPDIGADEFTDVSFSLGNDITVCVDAQYNLNAGDGFDSYLWSTGSDSSSTLIDSTSIGYGEKEISTIVILDGVTYKDTIMVRFSSPIAAAVSEYCFNENVDSIQITAGDAVSYSWYHGPTTQSIYITGGSWYQVTVTDENGCTDQADITIKHNFCTANLNMPNDTTIYYSEPIFLDANGPACEDVFGDYSSFLWNTGEATEKIYVDILQYGFGTHTFSVNIIDKSSLCESSDSVNITILGVGIDDQNDEKQVYIFPNPTSGLFNINGDDIERIEVYNLQGQILKSIKGEKRNPIDLSHFRKGIYFVKIIQEERYIIKKMILE